MCDWGFDDEDYWLSLYNQEYEEEQWLTQADSEGMEQDTIEYITYSQLRDRLQSGISIYNCEVEITEEIIQLDTQTVIQTEHPVSIENFTMYINGGYLYQIIILAKDNIAMSNIEIDGIALDIQGDDECRTSGTIRLTNFKTSNATYGLYVQRYNEVIMDNITICNMEKVALHVALSGTAILKNFNVSVCRTYGCSITGCQTVLVEDGSVDMVRTCECGHSSGIQLLNCAQSGVRKVQVSQCGSAGLRFGETMGTVRSVGIALCIDGVNIDSQSKIHIADDVKVTDCSNRVKHIKENRHK
eukprot:TRINITY_DN6429_c0_g2_i1.p2 TRINITY_DN6429_c0_g2~~TRINITY_DN6429_c0_g2_i1.p2  ORF type:complete len:300 (-),score=14.92 TRINITY_DN6429_c0_g2_i1:133-1032(-)